MAFLQLAKANLTSEVMDALKIDFVLPWVDGSDPKIQKKQRQFESSNEQNGAETNRFRDYGTLKYWFRAVFKYAAWVNHIYLITDHQVPEFLNLDNPKLTIIDHQQYIPEKYLPTFNSNTIELNLHRIPDLAEHFVLLNDDLFLNAAIRPDYFFDSEGLPKYAAVLRPIMPRTQFDHIFLNNLVILNNQFDKFEVLKKYRSKFLTVKYKARVLSNIVTYLNRGGFEGFQLMHTATPHLKSTFETVWSNVPDALERTCSDHFRAPERECNHYLIKDWNICSGHFSPTYYDQTNYFSLNQVQQNLNKFYETKRKILCINDDKIDNFELAISSLKEILSDKLPTKCPFEK